MVRPFAQYLRLLAAFAIALAFPIVGRTEGITHHTSKSTPAKSYGKIYNGTKLVGEVIELGPVLGADGLNGTVRQVTLLRPNGEKQEIALKLSALRNKRQAGPRFSEIRTKLQSAFEADHEDVLNYEVAGLRIVEPNGTEKPLSIIISTLADGSVYSKRASFILNPKHTWFNARLDTLNKLDQQVLSGISILSAHGLVHGDIRPENVLYTLDQDFDWKLPDLKKIHFSLSDFDSITPIGERIPVFTEIYAPPEGFTRKTFRASPAWDIYNHSVMTYFLLFGEKPYEDYFQSTHPDDYLLAEQNIERRRVYSDPERYAQFMKHVNQQFQNLEEQVLSPSARKSIQKLHASVVNGLAFSPEDRLKAFPEIQNGAKRFLEVGQKPKASCDGLLPNLIQSLK